MTVNIIYGKFYLRYQWIIMSSNEIDVDYEEAECPTCGGVIPLDAAECPECGQIFEEEEEDLWESEEASEEEIGDEWEELIEEEPSKGKLYLGILILLFGSVGLSFMSWFHNVMEWNILGVDRYAPDVYGPLDQMVGGSGAVISIIGIILIYLWYRDTRQEEISEEELFEDEEDYFEDEEEWGEDEEYLEEEEDEEDGEEEDIFGGEDDEEWDEE